MGRSRAVLVCMGMVAAAAAVGCQADPEITLIERDPPSVNVNACIPTSTAWGPISGGTPVKVHGKHLTSDSKILIGGEFLLEKRVVSSGLITGRTPPGTAAGLVKVELRSRDGNDRLGNGWCYTPGAFRIDQIRPNVGPLGQKIDVTITGEGFLKPRGGVPETEVLFGSTLLPPADVNVVDLRTIECKAPASNTERFVDVTVRLRSFPQQDTVPNGFEYRNCADPGLPITVQSVNPNSGPLAGGTRVTIGGTALVDGVIVSFGGNAGLNHDYSGEPCSLQVSTPPGKSPVPVDVTVFDPVTGDSFTLPGGFTYTPITITSVTPERGPLTGGTRVTVKGNGFLDPTDVTFDGVPGTGGVLLDSQTYEILTPPGAVPGPVDVVIANTNGTAILPDGFEYLPLSFDSIEPNFSTAAGGISVVISGTGLETTSRVLLGPNELQNLAVDPAGLWLTGTVPAGRAGPVDVTVETGLGDATLSDGFVYDPGPPQVDRITPNFAPRVGTDPGFDGDEVLIEGENFTTAPLVVTVVFDAGPPLLPSGTGGDDGVADNLQVTVQNSDIVNTRTIRIDVPAKTTASDNLEVVDVGAFTSVGATVTADAFAYAEWVHPGPLGGFITGIEVDPTSAGQVVYVGVSGLGTGGTGGVYKTTDGGASWFRVDQAGITDPNINGMDMSSGSPAVLYVGTPSGLFRTTDAGATWAPAGDLALGDPTTPILAVAVDPTDASGNTLFASSDTSTIYRSTDGGATATADVIPTGFPQQEVPALTVTPAGTAYAGSARSGVFRFDGVGAWTSVVDPGLTNGSIQSLEADRTGAGRVYAGTVGSGVFVFDETSGTWSGGGGTTATPLVYMIASDPGTAGRLYAAVDDIGGAAGGIFRSDDSGASWTEMSAGLELSGIDVEPTAVAVDPASALRVWAGALAGVFFSGDSAASWTEMQDGISNTNVKAIVRTSSGPSYAGTFGAGLFRSDDDGNTWTLVNTLPLPATRVQDVALDPSDPLLKIYVATADSGLWFSNDGGATWSPEFRDGSGDPIVQDITSIAIDPEFGTTSTVYIGTNGSGVWKTTMGGTPGMPFTRVQGDSILGLLTDPVIRSLHVTETIDRFRSPDVDPTQTPYPIQVVLTGTASEGVFSSTDGGASWQNFSVGLPNFDVRSIASGVELIVDPEFELRQAQNFFFYAGTFGGGVARGTASIVIIPDPFAPSTFISFLENMSWSEKNTGLDDPFVHALATDLPPDDDNVYVGTSDGVFVTGNSGVLWRKLDPGFTLSNPKVQAVGLVLDPACSNCTTVLGGTAGGGAGRIRILKQ